MLALIGSGLWCCSVSVPLWYSGLHFWAHSHPWKKIGDKQVGQCFITLSVCLCGVCLPVRYRQQCGCINMLLFVCGIPVSVKRPVVVRGAYLAAVVCCYVLQMYIPPIDRYPCSWTSKCMWRHNTWTCGCSLTISPLCPVQAWWMTKIVSTDVWARWILTNGTWSSNDLPGQYPQGKPGPYWTAGLKCNETFSVEKNQHCRKLALLLDIQYM